MNIINNKLERIFSIAVALDQSGGLKNTIHAIDKEVFIMNYDHTVLLRFRLNSSDNNFTEPVSFKANDYDSNKFKQEGNRITFFSENEGYSRKKTCGTTDITPIEVKELFESFYEDREKTNNVVLDNSIVSLLEEGLSHIEFIGIKNNPIKMIQRNIYSGGIIEIEKTSGKGELFNETLEYDFGPIAIKTDDFKAMFSFESIIKYNFPSNSSEDYILIKAINKGTMNMTGVIACCLYDEIIKLKEVKINGRKKQKIRRRK